MIDQITKPGFVIWFTGLPASGKTTLACAVQQRLANLHIHSVVLDSDELRAFLTPAPQYTESERCWFYNAVVCLAALLADNGINVLIAATANRCRYRTQARRRIKRFAEVYLDCPLALCRQRDHKGLYARANYQEDKLPGVGVIYEPPFAPEVTINTAEILPPEAAESAVRLLQLEQIIDKTIHSPPIITESSQSIPPSDEL